MCLVVHDPLSVRVHLCESGLASRTVTVRVNQNTGQKQFCPRLSCRTCSPQSPSVSTANTVGFLVSVNLIAGHALNVANVLNHYVCTYVCMHVRMYVRMHVRTYICMYVCLYVCRHVCTYVHMYVCLSVCMSVCMYADMKLSPPHLSSPFSFPDSIIVWGALYLLSL